MRYGKIEDAMMRFRVVAIDDDVSSLRLLGLMLHRLAEIDMIPVTNAAQFVERVAEIQPEVAITDDNMPGIDGMELVRRLKTDPRTERIPVMLWTASSDPVLRDEFWAMGGCDILDKPLHPDGMLERICGAIARGTWETLPEPRWKEVFLAKFEDKKSFWRAAMLRCFSGQPLPDFVLERFDRLLHDPAASVRQQAMNCLSNANAPQLLSIQIRLAQDIDYKTRYAALEGLAHQHDPGAILTLLDALQDPDLTVRKLVFRGLQGKTYEAILPALIDGLAEEDDELRWEIAIEITQRLDKLAKPFWVRQLLHTDARIRAEAEAMLKAMSRAGAAADRW